MNTINSNRITGLATGMDIDEMVTNMITGEYGNKKFIEM